MFKTFNKTSPALLALEEGSIFCGTSIGIQGKTVGEVVFNTAMTGYQEILTDPSYAQQIVTLTYPHIGNTGTNHIDQESYQVWSAGLIIRDLPTTASNWRQEISLADYLIKNKVVAIADIDTRRLTTILREKGALKGCIITNSLDEKAAIAAAKAFAGIQGVDLAKVVTTKTSYQWEQTPSYGYQSSQFDPLFHVVTYDFGVKHSILQQLAKRQCRITIVPATTSAKEVLALKPDGVLLANGPGDPAACPYAIEAIEVLLKKEMPLFGICLGHQLLALACGAKTVKMKFGHHGANHPVQNLETGQVMVTSQNHSFAVDETTLPSCLQATHRSLFDGSLQGIRHTEKPAFSFQGHPEGSPGPHDAAHLFDQFIQYMQLKMAI